MKKKILIAGKEEDFTSGLVLGENLYALAQCDEQQCLYFSREDGIDIPVSKSDFIVIHGGEKFVIGKLGAIEDNPQLRNSICPEFNGKKEGISFPVAKNFGKDIIAKDDKLPNGRLFVDLPDSVDEQIRDDMRIIVQGKDSYFVIPPSNDDDNHIDVEECIKHDTRIPKGQKYRIRIDGDKYVTETMIITGASILALVGKNVNEWTLNQKLKGGERKNILPSNSLNLSVCGVERFETVCNTQQQGS